MTRHLDGIQRLGRLVTRGDCIAPRVPILPLLQIALCTIQQRLSLAEFLRILLLGSSLSRGTDRLAGIAHLLRRSASAGSQPGTQKQHAKGNEMSRNHVNHGGFFNRP